MSSYRQLKIVGEQRECSETMKEKEYTLNRENSETETDTSEDVSDKGNNTRNKVNLWRDSGYITSDSEDFIMNQFEIKTEIVVNYQERIASIFWL